MITADFPLLMNVTAKIIQVVSVGVKNYFRGLGVALLGCHLNQRFYGNMHCTFDHNNCKRWPNQGRIQECGHTRRTHVRVDKQHVLLGLNGEPTIAMVQPVYYNNYYGQEHGSHLEGLGGLAKSRIL